MCSCLVCASQVCDCLPSRCGGAGLFEALFGFRSVSRTFRVKSFWCLCQIWSMCLPPVSLPEWINSKETINHHSDRHIDICVSLVDVSAGQMCRNRKKTMLETLEMSHDFYMRSIHRSSHGDDMCLSSADRTATSSAVNHTEHSFLKCIILFKYVWKPKGTSELNWN